MSVFSDLWGRCAWHTAFLAAGLVVAATGLSFAQQTAAQDNGGGVSYTFGIDQRLQWQSNPGLDTPAGASEATSHTRLSFGVISQTRTQRLAFSAAGTLAAGNGLSTGFISPQAELSYALEGPASKLELTAFFRESDVSETSFIAGVDAGGAPILTSVEGTGIQQRKGATARLDFGLDAPFGGSLSLGLTDTDYTGTTDPSLIDNRRTNARLSLRFDLTEVTTATAALSTSRLKEVGAAAEQTDTLSLGLEQALPNGALTLDATYAHLNTGNRQSLSLGRSLDLPAGRLAASLGVSSLAAGGGTRAIGTLDWRQDLARGSLTLGLSRAVSGNARDDEAAVTRLTLGVTQELGPRLGLSANLGLQDSRDTATNAKTTGTTLSAALRYDLTEDWGLDLGATHRIRRETGAARAKSNTVFLSLNRNFEFRP